MSSLIDRGICQYFEDASAGQNKFLFWNKKAMNALDFRFAVLKGFEVVEQMHPYSLVLLVRIEMTCFGV